MPELAALAREHGAWLMSDDAHGLGVVGDGRGSSFAHGERVDVPLQMGTLSKAAGAYGGYLCASESVVELVRNRARSFVYSTGLPPGTVAAASRALDLIATNVDLVRRPLALARLFTTELGLRAAESPIVSVVLGSAERALARATSSGSRASSSRRSVRRPCRPARRGCESRSRPRIARSACTRSRPRCVHSSRTSASRATRTADESGIRDCQPPMNTVFVTATGTDVGKTFVTARLVAELRAARRSVLALKPVASGFDAENVAATDTGVLLDALGLAATPANLDAVSPWRFAAALSPDMAAARERRAIPFDELLEFCRAPRPADVTLIEGIGGVMVPLDDAHTVLDWIVELGAPVVLVAGSYLGTLSHTLTAIAALRARAVEPAAIIVSESEVQPVPLEETAQTVRRFVAPVTVAALPRHSGETTLLPLLAGLFQAA